MSMIKLTRKSIELNF